MSFRSWKTFPPADASRGRPGKSSYVSAGMREGRAGDYFSVMGREAEIVSAVRDSATFLGGTRRDHDALLERAPDGRLVPLGEPSHGSHEVYRERARISQRLIEELGFNAVV